MPVALCYFFDPLQQQGGKGSSTPPLGFHILSELRLSHTLSRPSHLVVHAAFACALLPHRVSKSIREGFKSTHRLSIPLLPSCTVGGVKALGLINLQVVPPFVGIETLSQTSMLFIVGVGTYNIAGASDCNIIGPKFPVVVI